MKDSAAVGLIQHLWNGRQEATGHSWLRLNQGLRDGLFLAVRIGLEFGENDLEDIAKRFRGGYWFGADMESFYRCAVVFGNRSAWKAYEAWTKRKPFIWKSASLRGPWGAGGTGITTPPRLTVGCTLTWKGEEVTVTSFNDDKGYLTACSYNRPDSDDCSECGHQKTWPKETILHRFSITHADLAEAKKEKRAV